MKPVPRPCGWQKDLLSRRVLPEGPSVRKALDRAERALEKAAARVNILKAACHHPVDERELFVYSTFDTLGNRDGSVYVVRCRCGREIDREAV